MTTETRHLDRLGQLSDFEQDDNTNPEQKCNTDSHSARNKAHVAQQSAVVIVGQSLLSTGAEGTVVCALFPRVTDIATDCRPLARPHVFNSVVCATHHFSVGCGLH